MKYRHLLTALAAMASLALGSSGAHAATFVVTNLDDSGPGSLRQAVLDANALAGADVIVFQAGLAGTITLTSARLSLTEDLEIQGPGAEVLTVRGNDADSVFRIGGFNTVNVTISGLTITGRVSGNQLIGGGIVNEAEGNLTLMDCILSGCSAETDGGAIYNFGNLTLTNCTLSGNSAGTYGGGIYNNGGKLKLVDSTLSGNSGHISGGGIYNLLGTVTLTSCTLSGNRTADDSFGGSGSGIFNGGGTLTAKGCAFSNNSAKRGGGGIAVTPMSTATVEDCTFDSNSAADGSGGGIFNGGTLRMNACTFSGNSAGFLGGGIANDGELILTSSTLSNNSVTVDVFSEGGGIFNGGTLRASFCTISGNEGRRAGGGLFNEGDLTLADSTVSGNNAVGGGGIANLGNLTVTDSTFSSNSADIGGGISSDAGTVMLTNCTLFANSASNDGGGVGLRGGTLTARSCTIAGNGAGGSGGGILNSGELTVQSSTVNGNIASEGGGILNQPPVIIEGPEPLGSPGTATLQNSTLSNNRAFRGGGLFNQGVALLTNCTLSRNLADPAEGGAIRNSGIMEVGNTILARSGPGLNCYDEGLVNSLGHNLDSDDACSLAGSGDQSGSPAIPLDPGLGPLQNNGGPTETHALLSGSPAIDAGDGALAPAGTDQRGFPRIADGNANGTAIIDIGAFELSFFDASPFEGISGQFLTYSSVYEQNTLLPAGTSGFNLTVHYSGNIAPQTFVAVLNGKKLIGFFHPTPGGTETVRIPLRAGQNLLSLRVKGTVDGKRAEDVDNLGFRVGDPAFGPR